MTSIITSIISIMIDIDDSTTRFCHGGGIISRITNMFEFEFILVLSSGTKFNKHGNDNDTGNDTVTLFRDNTKRRR